MKTIPAALTHCGRCGSTELTFDGEKRYRCPDCGWVYYQNPCAAVVGVLQVGDKVLFTRRNREPAKGTLDLPGGFVDGGETGEEALVRELMEELSLDLSVTELEYLGSLPNDYLYREVDYQTLDLFYRVRLEEVPSTFDPDELSGIELRDPSTVAPSEIGLSSIRKGVKRWL